MPGAARLGDLCSGHGCWPSRPNIQASPDTFVNGIAQHRQSDAWATHCCPSIPQCHSSVLAQGSPIAFVNGLQRGRIADPVACGSIVATGSMDTSIGPEPITGPGSPGFGPIDTIYFKYFRAGRGRSGDPLLDISNQPFED